MLQVIMTIGLSGSGKTTWAETYVKEHPNAAIICKDDLRLKHPNLNEKNIIHLRNCLILENLKAGKDLLIVDTNLNPIHAKRIRKIAEGLATVEEKSFLDVPIETCIERTANRPEGKEFWERIIRKQQADWLPPFFVEQDPSLPLCVISDFDGTIAHPTNRSPYDGTNSHQDIENAIVCDYLKMIANEEYTDVKIFILSGLEDKYRPQREEWLKVHNIPYDGLFMRQTDDRRKDWIIKDELFKEHIEGKYFVFSILDDRPQMIRWWWDRGYGNRLFTVGNPYKEF